VTALRAWSSARFAVPLPDGHRFPIAKYALVRDEIVRRGLITAETIAEPEAADVDSLGLAHTSEYVSSILHGTLTADAVRRLGLPWSPGLRERSLRTVQGTVEAARDALASGWGINLAGGTHHAFADRGEGFCVFNDVAVAIRRLREEGRLGRAAVIDLDVHQGNGTAHLFAGDDSVFTFSMHGEKNYPFHKEPGRLDIGLPDGADDPTYLAALDRHLGPALDAAAPALVFYLAGADPYRNDRFGRLRLSMDGLRARDGRVFEACRARGLPVVLTLAGGYAQDLGEIAAIHANTIEELMACCA
jgi:acetoin utilization deacetylase AcuC-like enzyme